MEEAWRRAERRGARREQKESALAALEALAWHRQMDGENTEAAFCQVLQDHGLAATRQGAEDVLALLREKVGLLAREVERRDGKDIPRYLFAHQTVREYFVALHLKRAWEQNARRTWCFLKPRLHLAE